MAARSILVVLHRYAGLTIAAFLVVSGLTGSLIAFQNELDEWFNPDLFRVSWSGQPLPASELAARIEKADPRVRVRYVPLNPEAGYAASMFVTPRFDPEAGKPFEPGYDQVFANPATGEVVGKRQWGACCLERENLMPFVYRLHYTLHIPGPWGRWLFGVVAIIWLLDCLFGFALTLPRGRFRWESWKTSWKIKWRSSSYRLNFDLHRATGLWLWLVLFVIALSGIQLNLDREVFRPVVEIFSPVTKTPFETRKPRGLNENVKTVTFDEAVRRGTEEAIRQGLGQPSGVSHYFRYGIYVLKFEPPAADQGILDLGDPYMALDDLDGRYLGVLIPGQGTGGDIFTHIQFPLHSGRIAGLPGRIFISAMGVLVAMLSITGVVIWSRKRNGRVRRNPAAGRGLRGSAAGAKDSRA